MSIDTLSQGPDVSSKTDKVWATINSWLNSLMSTTRIGLDRDVHAFHASHVEVRDSVLLGKLRILTYRQKSNLIHQPESQR